MATEANGTMRPAHHRMPAILAAPACDEWLQREPLEMRRWAELLVPAPDGLLDRWEVGPAVNSVNNDGPELVAATGTVVGSERGRTKITVRKYDCSRAR
jgi:putative SOS response-associated peptidase YedK